MTPRGEIVYLDLDAPLAENLAKIANSEHSRFPVCRGGIENVLGFVVAKHLLRDTTRGHEVDIQAHLVPALYVPETIKVMNLIELMKARRETSALIVDEFGDIQGLATVHDVMEALVGDIASVNNEAEADAVQRDDGSWLMDAGMSVQRFKDVLDIRESLPDEEDEAYHTLAGFVITVLGRIPRTGDIVQWASYRLEVVDMDRNRIDKLLVSRASPAAPKPRAGANSGEPPLSRGGNPDER